MRVTKREILFLVLRILAAGILFAVAMANYETLTTIDIRQLVDRSTSSTSAVFAVLSVYCIKGLVFIVPASLIYTSVGLAFDAYIAVIINLIGITAEIIISYTLGRILSGEYVERLLQKNKGGKKLLAMKQQNKYRAMIIARLLPVFPIDFTSLFLGSSKTAFLPYLLISFLGIAPRVVLFTILGDSIYDFIPMALLVKIIICSIPVFAAVYLIRWIIKKKKGEP